MEGAPLPCTHSTAPQRAKTQHNRRIRRPHNRPTTLPPHGRLTRTVLCCGASALRPPLLHSAPESGAKSGAKVWILKVWSKVLAFLMKSSEPPPPLSGVRYGDGGFQDYGVPRIGPLLLFKPSLRSSPVTPPIFRPFGQPETRFADEKVVTQ